MKQLKIIRIIPIKDNDKFKSNKLELGIITINLSKIKSPDGTCTSLMDTFIKGIILISFIHGVIRVCMKLVLIEM